MACGSSPEICWKFHFHDNLSEEILDQFSTAFVEDFVEANNWYCGGGFDNMCMYDITQHSSLAFMKAQLIKYLSTQQKIVHAITMQDYDDSKDAFVDTELIKISK